MSHVHTGMSGGIQVGIPTAAIWGPVGIPTQLPAYLGVNSYFKYPVLVFHTKLLLEFPNSQRLWKKFLLVFLHVPYPGTGYRYRVPVYTCTRARLPWYA